MNITTKLLEHFDAPQHLINFFQQNFVEGASLFEIIQNPDTPFEFLYFLKKYVPFTEEEKKSYRSRCTIDENCDLIWESSHVGFSRDVVRSHFIKDSTHIRNSRNVERSKDVYNSFDVVRSDNIAFSKDVKNCSRIIDSRDVVESSNVLGSNLITWANNISYSFIIEESDFIYKSNNLEDCFFCGFSKNSKHCLFCVGVEDEEYMIFNEKVDIQEFSLWKEELQLVLAGERSEFIELALKEHTAEKRFKFNSRFDSIFRGLSDSFYGWVGNMPNYSDEIFLTLFFRDQQEFEN